jgi:GTP1/Obg family GTP-binding protein
MKKIFKYMKNCFKILLHLDGCDNESIIVDSKEFEKLLSKVSRLKTQNLHMTGRYKEIVLENQNLEKLKDFYQDAVERWMQECVKLKNTLDIFEDSIKEDKNLREKLRNNHRDLINYYADILNEYTRLKQRETLKE